MSPMPRILKHLNWVSYGHFTGGCPSRGSQGQFVRFRVLDLVNVGIRGNTKHKGCRQETKIFKKGNIAKF